jgi:hypothetical protein
VDVPAGVDVNFADSETALGPIVLMSRHRPECR